MTRAALAAPTSWWVRLCRALPGIALGLYLSRIAAESYPHAWRWWQLVPFIAGGLAIGITASILLARRYRIWPLAVALAYVPWPLPSGQAAAAVGLAMLVTWLTANRLGERHTLWHDLTLGAAALALYGRTLAPGLQPADAGEFQIVAATLGIAHPPGYPLYSMVGWLFTRLPLADPALRLNLFAAVCAAASVGVVSRAVGKATGSGCAALAAGACLAVTPTFWAQGTFANIRSLTALFVALGLAQALRWERTRRTGDLTLLGLALGLGIGHHSSLLLLLPAYAAFVLLSEPRLIARPRLWAGMLGAALASLAVIAYLPLRSRMSPAFAPALVNSWGDLASHVLALGFRGDMLRYTAWDELLRRAGALAQILRLEHGALLLALATVALVACLARRTRIVVLIGGIWLLNVLSAITYRAPQTVEYLIPAYIALAIMLGIGLAKAAPAGWPRAALWATLALAIAGLGQASWPSMEALHHDDRTRQEAESLLAAAPDGALVLSGWHQATPLWYLQLVEGLRPDVTVTYVYPEGATPNAEVWQRRIHEAAPARAVAVTNRFHAFDDAGLLLEPLGSGWLVRKELLPAATSAMPVAIFGDQLAFQSQGIASTSLEPGDALSVEIDLLAIAPVDADYTLFLQLIGPTGVVGQDDRCLPTMQLNPGERLRARLEPTLLVHCAPGDYSLIAGLYKAGAAGIQRLQTAGGDTFTLGVVTVQPRETRTVSAHPRDWRWANGLRLLGLDADHSVAGQTRLYVHLGARRDLASGSSLVASADGVELTRATIPALPAAHYALLALDLPGHAGRITLAVENDSGLAPVLGAWNRQGDGEKQIALSELGDRFVPLGGEVALTAWAADCGPDACALSAEFLAQRPLTHDYAVSLGLRGAQEIKSDGTPVNGAIPTLKWLAGWRVVDERQVTLPAPEPPTTGLLTMYDSFTLRALPVLDERLVRSGQGIELLLPIEP
jgi:hypothetical protein